MKIKRWLEKYQEVQSMAGIVAFVCSAEALSRKVAYHRTDNSLVATAS